MERDRTKLNVGFIARIILVVVIALIVGLSVFTCVRISVGANDALREAKNVHMALRAADIEMYAAKKTVYNPTKKNGVEEGVKEKADQIFVSTGEYKITSYNSKAHEITGFQYEIGNYLVTYEKDGKHYSWDVDYVLRVYSFDDEDDIVNGD